MINKILKEKKLSEIPKNVKDERIMMPNIGTSMKSPIVASARAKMSSTVSDGSAFLSHSRNKMQAGGSQRS